MSVRERLFPMSPTNPHVLIKTEFVGSWESQFRGLGRLTCFLGEQLPQFSAAYDDLGLGAIFLQRHHAELGLKLLLERVEAAIEPGHRISALLRACGTAFDEHGWASEWQRFSDDQIDYLTVLDDIDPSGFAYRYPVDPQLRPVGRPPFVDFVALSTAGAAFEQAVMRIIDSLARAEALEVPEEELESTLDSFAAAVRAARTTLAFAAASAPAVSQHSRELGLPALPPTPEIAAARAKGNAHTALLRQLEAPLLRVIDQLRARRTVNDDELNLAPHEIPARPPGRGGTPVDIRNSMLALEKWQATGLAQLARELKPALRTVAVRSGRWAGPASRQLHNDIARVLSRL